VLLDLRVAKPAKWVSFGLLKRLIQRQYRVLNNREGSKMTPLVSFK
jgi:hypothetical protein